jgi:hypothetical protein
VSFTFVLPLAASPHSAAKPQAAKQEIREGQVWRLPLNPETQDRLVALALGIAVCALCVIRAIYAETRSRRLALTGLACAVAVLPLAAGAFLAGTAERSEVFVLAGVLVVCAGLAAVVFSLRAKAAKKIDSGTGNVAPAAALVLGIAGGLLGAWLIAHPASGP